MASRITSRGGLRETGWLISRQELSLNLARVVLRNGPSLAPPSGFAVALVAAHQVARVVAVALVVVDQVALSSVVALVGVDQVAQAVVVALVVVDQVALAVVVAQVVGGQVHCYRHHRLARRRRCGCRGHRRL